MPHANLIEGNTSSATSLERAKKWIEECESSHRLCRSGRHVELPKRLVDVASVLHLNEPGVRLVGTEGMTGSYACLSHCWGRDPIVARSTSKTIQDFKNFISWSLLPRNFQDAITLTRELGIPYIWIDSLCIIQDDLADWERESAKMAKIYQDSFVTVAATASPNAAGGCFTRIQPDRCLHVEVDDNLSFYLGVRDCSDVVHNRDPDAFTKTFPLFTRGWVYQERKLSRRTLYCNRGELSFECGEVSRCECGNPTIAPHLPQGLIGKQIFQTSKKSRIHPSIPIQRVATELSSNRLRIGWRRIVTEYTQLKLTYSKDMLPALSGLAKEMANITGDTYLAGVWRKSLDNDLLWFVAQRGRGVGNQHVQTSRKDNQYWRQRPPWRAPSWSWASVDTGRGVEFSSLVLHPSSLPFDQRVKAAECAPAGFDTTGAVKSGLLHLVTSLVPTYLRYICHHCRRNAAPTRKQVYAIETSDQFYAGSRERRLHSLCRFQVEGLEVRDSMPTFHPDTFYKLDDFDSVVTPALGSRKKCCKIAPICLLHVNLRSHWIQSHVEVYDFFLALRKADATTQEYTRIGLFVLGYKDIEQRNAWFNEVWKLKMTPEEEIYLV
jgi:Heterokaryon incompatibility protein (HET)